MTTLTYTNKQQADETAEYMTLHGYVVTIVFDGRLYVLILEELEK